MHVPLEDKQLPHEEDETPGTDNQAELDSEVIPSDEVEDDPIVTAEEPVASASEDVTDPQPAASEQVEDQSPSGQDEPPLDWDDSESGETPESVADAAPDEELSTDSNIRLDKRSLFETAAAAIDEVADEPEAIIEKPKSKPRRVRRRDARRLAHYAELRREQYDEFNELLETLTRVDDLADEHLNHVRDAIFHADHPFLLTMVGPFSAGKSSVINALLGDKVLEIGPIPTTDHIAIMRYGPTFQESRSGETRTIFYPSELLRGLSLVDTPGLESVFEHHDEVTLKFLHRADIVVLVMLATQVLTAHDLDFMKNLRQVGKRLIIVVNQIDLLDESDRQLVYNFVEEQSRIHLGFGPLIWLVSAKQALTAYETDPRDEIIWDESGMAEVEEYLDETLDDAERVRQKLETPLQVAQNATRAALEHVRTAQNAISEHR
jgi:small GTP-binding protein